MVRCRNCRKMVDERVPNPRYTGTRDQAREICAPCADRVVNPVLYADGMTMAERRALWSEARASNDPAAITRLKRDVSLRRTYGITHEEFDALLAKQGGGCSICSRGPEERVMVVDHDHDSNRIRGILCRECNAAVGNLGDAYPNVMRAAVYLVQARLREMENTAS